MFTLDNYPKLGSYILVDNKTNTYSIEDTEDWDRPVQGVGGVSEDGQVVGFYVDAGNLYFYYQEQSFEASPHELDIDNQYISKGVRCFRVHIRGVEVCKIVYTPYIDPGMIYYDADPEEFDALLYLSNFLRDEESLHRFIRRMEQIKEQNEG